MNAKPLLALSLISITAALSGCATSDFQGAFLVGDRFNRARIDTQPVLILSVDDRDTTQRRVLVDPGVRLVRVQAPPVPGARQETATLKIDVQPCMQYYIVAVRANRLTAQFTPEVDHVERIGGCTPAEPKK
jgi:hypothetical protein